MLLAASASSIPELVVAWTLSQVGYSATLAAFLGLIPERVRPHLLGRVSGLVGLVTALAVLAGVTFASRSSRSPLLVFGVPASVVIVAMVALTVVAGGADIRQPGLLDWRAFVRMFWISPRSHPDFAWTWMSRVLVGLAMAALSGYVTYFLTDHLNMPVQVAADHYAGLVALTTPLTLACFVLAGVVSDRSGRRKLLVVISALVIALALGLAAATASVGGTYAVWIAYSVGRSFFLTVDVAVAATVVPPREAARAMALYQVGCTAPESLVGVLAPLLISLGGDHGYPLAFGVFAVFAVVGGALILPVRSVR